MICYSAAFADVVVCLCLSVTYAGIVSKRLNGSSWLLIWRLPSDLFHTVLERNTGNSTTAQQNAEIGDRGEAVNLVTFIFIYDLDLYIVTLTFNYDLDLEL